MMERFWKIFNYCYPLAIRVIRFSDIFKWYWTRPLAWNGLIQRTGPHKKFYLRSSTGPHSTAEIRSFPLRISSVNMIRAAGNCEKFFLCSGGFDLGAMPTYTYFKVSIRWFLIFSTTPICIELLVIPNELCIFCSEVISTHKTNIDNNYQ